MATLKELRDERLRKLSKFKDLGIETYPETAHRSVELAKISDNFKKYDGKNVQIVGRILNIRKFGKIAFIVIKDQSGTIQLFLENGYIQSRNNQIDRSQLDFSLLNLLDSGDFIEASGEVFKTKTDEISIKVKTFRILVKSLRPLPLSKEGFANKEERLRRRYVDINVNQDVKERFIRRSNFWRYVREYLLENDFIEINIPVLEHTTGGADAKPFVTHMDALDQDFYLRISHELPLKRLIGAGYEKVFDIGPRFRNENYSDEHLPEHIAMESYTAFQNFEDGIDFYEKMLKKVIKKTWGKLKFEFDDFELDLDKKWPVIEYKDILKDKFGIDIFNVKINELINILRANNVKLEGEINLSRALDNAWKIIRKQSVGPFWLVHEPSYLSPLAKVYSKDPRVCQRFHPVFLFTEMGNGYAELNNPIEQLDKFLEQEKMREGGDSEAQMLDIDFVEMLEYGMPPTCGWGISERIFWALEKVSAREGVPFPQLRKEVDSVTKTIYPEIFK